MSSVDEAQCGNHPPPSQIFCLMCFPILQRPGRKSRKKPQLGGKPQWDGAKHIQDLSIVCGSASIAFGLNEPHMDESKDCPRNGRAAQPLSDHERLLLLHVDAPAGRAAELR
jgi:hypothetical protein